jgi:pimeloyl-ACP methyl ester carboxylesterase
MATFVIVHGGFGGGWEWTPVANLLRRRGHDVFTPTLSGMGERAHVALDEALGLSTHIQDVIAVLEFEDLRRVVLCGASYGGMPVTGAADRVPDRIRLVAYVDALVPSDGQCALDLLPAAFRETVNGGLAAHGPGWRVPIPDLLLESLYPPGALEEPERARVLARIRPQPAASFVERVHLTGAVERLPRAFIRCTATGWTSAAGGDPVAEGAARARAEGWLYEELPLGHDPHLFNPALTAATLEELASAAHD